MKGQELHDLAVRSIAGELFSFQGSQLFPGPGGYHPSWVVYTNVPKQQMSVEHPWRGQLYPDIVIVDIAKGNAPKLAAEVETEETLYKMETLEKWKEDADICGLYLLIPEGHALGVASLLLKVRPALRLPRAMYTYGFDPSWNFRLTPV